MANHQPHSILRKDGARRPLVSSPPGAQSRGREEQTPKLNRSLSHFIRSCSRVSLEVSRDLAARAARDPDAVGRARIMAQTKHVGYDILYMLDYRDLASDSHPILNLTKYEGHTALTNAVR